MKYINKKLMLSFLVSITGVEFSSDSGFSSVIYYLCNKDESGMTYEKYQLEFISATSVHLYEVRLTGVDCEVDMALHEQLVRYCKSLNLGRTIGVSTDFGVSIV